MAPKSHQVVPRLLIVKSEDHVSKREKQCRELTMLWVEHNGMCETLEKKIF
jgi:hypothetical protein